MAQAQGDTYLEALQQQIAECEDREMQYIERHNRVQVRGLAIPVLRFLSLMPFVICKKFNSNGSASTTI